jgi:hypothetical protein
MPSHLFLVTVREYHPTGLMWLALMVQLFLGIGPEISDAVKDIYVAANVRHDNLYYLSPPQDLH